MITKEQSVNSEFYIPIVAKLDTNDTNPDIVKRPKIWVRVGSTYKCGNCGKIPTFIHISELKKCPHCEILKSFYEDENGDLIPMWTKDMLKGEYPNVEYRKDLSTGSTNNDG